MGYLKLDEAKTSVSLASARRLRVLMATPRYFPDMGGIETHVHEVGKRLVRNGVDVTVLTTLPTSSSGLPREEDVEGMHVIRLKSWPPKTDYYIVPEMVSIIKGGSWDLVHCQGCHTFVPPLAMMAAREARVPYVLTFHTGGHSSRIRSRIRSLQWQALRPLLAHAQKLVGVSRFEVEYFRDSLHLPASLFTQISNGAALPVPAVSSSQGPVDPRRWPLIVSSGRLERYKGHHRLIEALPHLLLRYPDAHLLILGRGPYEDELRLLAQRLGVSAAVDIRALPPSDRSGMTATLQQAQVMALFSEYEAHPIAVMEALALNRPVLVSDSSGFRELAEQGLVRAVPLAATPEQLASALVQQVEDPLLPPKAFSLPTWEECALQLQAVYESAVMAVR